MTKTQLDKYFIELLIIQIFPTMLKTQRNPNFTQGHTVFDLVSCRYEGGSQRTPVNVT